MKARYGILALLLLLAIALATLLLRGGSGSFNPGSLPSPNGYDEFVKAGESIKTLSIDLSKSISTSNTNDLAILVNLNREATTTIRSGLLHQCRVPLDASPGAATNTTRLEHMGALKSCGQLLIAEGTLAKASHDFDTAAKAYFDTFRLGCAVMRGGVVIDAMVGFAIQGMALAGLEKLLPTSTSRQAASLVEPLRSLAAESEPARQILERELAWSKAVHGWRGALVRTVRPGMFRKTEQGLLSREATRDQALQRLIEEATARANLPGGENH